MYQRILVPVDGSATSIRGMAQAVELARRLGARLRLIHVVDELSLAGAMDAYSVHGGDWLTILREGGSQVLDQARQTAREAGVEAEICMVNSPSGTVSAFILDEARRWQADLIVLGTHGRRGPRRWLLGSTAEAIVRQATVPVLLVRADPGLDDLLLDEAQAARASRPGHVNLPSQALSFD